MSEVSTYLAEIDWVLREQAACVETLTAEEVNLAPGEASTNSAAAIVGHTLAVTEAFVFGVVLGHAHVRNRPAEFATVFPDRAEALSAIGELRRRLAELDVSMIDPGQIVTPDPRTWGSTDVEPMELRRVLAETLRHAAIHLGELRFTRRLAIERGLAGG